MNVARVLARLTQSGTQGRQVGLTHSSLNDHRVLSCIRDNSAVFGPPSCAIMVLLRSTQDTARMAGYASIGSFHEVTD